MIDNEEIKVQIKVQIISEEALTDDKNKIRYAERVVCKSGSFLYGGKVI